MPITTEYQSPSLVPLTFLSRSILSFRRNQVVAMDNTQDQEELEEIELFQKHVADRFIDLSSTHKSGDGDEFVGDNLLSIAWLRKLLDVFLCCESEFKVVHILGRDASQFSKSPLDRLIPELLDRTVKALDLCNVITEGIQSIRQWQKLAEIAVSALGQNPLGEAQLRRAKKALNSLLTSMKFDDKESYTRSTERAWSFSRKNGGSSSSKDRSSGHFRSISWSVSKNWSAAKQIQAISANLMTPRGGDSSGLAKAVYIMSTVLVFVMWFLVAAIPCQDRTGIATNLHFPRQMAWMMPMIGLQERIAEEWKKKEKKGSTGLLEELMKLEKCGQALIEMADSVQFPLETEQAEEIKQQVVELTETCRKMDEGLIPLERQVREVFRRIVRSRAEILDTLDEVGKSSSPVL